MSKVTVNKINTQFSEEYTEQDLNLVPAFDVISQFIPERDNVEFSIYNEQGLLEYIDYNYTNYTVTLDYNTQQNSVSTVNVNVEEDVIKEGYEQGNYTANYIFLRNQLSSSVDNPYYIKQISSDRTELRVANNNIENEELENIVNQFKAELSSSVYFEDFQLNLGNNNIFIANNILVDTSDPNQYTVLLKLYEPLEEQFGVKDTLWVTLQTADEVSYQVNFTPKVNVPPPPPQLKGPNFNIETKDTANNSTVYQDLDSLLTTVLTSSYNQIQGILAEKGITINVDYSDFNNFVYFSSAEKRVRNFFYKLEQIQEIDDEIYILDNDTVLTNPSSSIAILEQKKSKIIQNFDGYEKHQYYTSGSSTSEGIYPKQSIYPYRPVSTTNASATSWLARETISGSNYDLENPDRLVNSLPTFVVDNTDNTPFLDFMDMVGQHFDNVWTYTKDISNRFDADNRLNYGISKDLVADAIRSMGVNLYQNNFTDTNLYTAFTNLNPDGTGSYLNENTNELILDYITTQYNSKGQVEADTTYQLGDVFYFLLGGNIVNSPLYFYVNQSTYISPDNGGSDNDAAYLLLLLSDVGGGIIALSNFDGQPTIIDDVNKEIYKRIYHNLPYLLKKKGSIEGLRALINCYGIPDTILRISEFGGKDKTNSNDWDYFQNKFNYALNISGSSWGNFSSRWSINSAWPERMGLSPTTFTLRFKPDTLPSSNTDYKVLTNVSPSNLGGWALALEYTGSGLLSSSYSGSIPSESKYDANLILWNTEDDEEIVRVTAPFYNKNWWTTAITVDPTTSATGDIVLYALESIYNGNDGFKLGVNTSASYSGDTSWWDGTTIHIPSQYSTGVTLDGTSYTPLTGSFQEVKYYGVPLNRSRVYDLAMNPYSIEGNNYSSSANDLAFRAPLGSDLLLTNLTQSVHPKITGSFGFITQSFANDESFYEISEPVKNNFVPNTEFIYYDQPAVGIKNRISEKIRSVDNITPSGDVLTPYRTIQQRYPQSESYTRDVNYLEVAFSPQNEINDDINSSFGYFNIGEYIGDPRQVSESNTSYQDLDRLRDDYFQKYYKSYNWKDYIRLIKYFDNSLFKMIKDFVPAKTSVSTGVVIKQHLLERNKQRPTLLSSSLYEYTGSISSSFISGGSAGVFDDLPTVTPEITQSWTYAIPTLSGSLILTQSTQDEFYNGELSGSTITVGIQTVIQPTSSLFPAAYINLQGENTFPVSIPLADIGGQGYFIVNTEGNLEGFHLNRQSYGFNFSNKKRITGGNVPIPTIVDSEEYWLNIAEGDFLEFIIISGSIQNPPSQKSQQSYKIKVNEIEINEENIKIVLFPYDVSDNNFGNPFYRFQLDGEDAGIQFIWLYEPDNLKEQNSFTENVNNADVSRKSNIFMDIDFASNGDGIRIPSNIDAISAGLAVKAPVQDSNYTSRAWYTNRYNGSKISSLDFNK